MIKEKYRVLVTGGTGFIGGAMIQRIINESLSYQRPTEIHVLTRGDYSSKYYTSGIEVRYYKANISEINTLPGKKYDLIIHAASPTSGERFSMNYSELDRFKAVVLGTENLLNAMKKSKIDNFLYLSSGAIYGSEYLHGPRESELYAASTISSFAFYSEAKRATETMCFLASHDYKFKMNIARIFAIVGPGMYLAENSNYIFTNFIQDSYYRRPYKIKGNFNSKRSFLDIEDCVDALFLVINSTSNGHIYNIGSEEIINLKRLAEKFNTTLNFGLKVDISEADLEGKPNNLYPNVDKIKLELNWRQKYDLKASILKTYEYFVGMKKD